MSFALSFTNTAYTRPPSAVITTVEVAAEQATLVFVAEEKLDAPSFSGVGLEPRRKPRIAASPIMMMNSIFFMAFVSPPIPAPEEAGWADNVYLVVSLITWAATVESVDEASVTVSLKSAGVEDEIAVA